MFYLASTEDVFVMLAIERRKVAVNVGGVDGVGLKPRKYGPRSTW